MPIGAEPACDVAVVGAGPGGIYFAWRLLESGSNQSVCMFERSGRFGGRIFSLRNQGAHKDLVVDLGAYRYAPAPFKEGSWYVYTPLLGALIDTALKLRSASYEPGDEQSTVRKIVDADGQNAGYSTFVEAMMAQLQSYGEPSFQLQYNEELASLAPVTAQARVRLTFASGLTVTAAKVLLNLPQLPLLKVLSQSPSSLFGPAGLPSALQVPTPMDGVKFYVHYTNAWWRNLLNLTSGSFGDGYNRSATLTQLPSLAGRYHDGHTRCDGPPAAECRGYLEAEYTYATAARFFLNHQLNAELPYSELDYSKPAGRYALDMIHQVLLDYHAPALDSLSRAAGYNATALVAKLRPDSALLSYWGAQTPGYGGAIHQTRSGPLLEVTELAPAAMAPFGELPIFVANEAFGALRGSDADLSTHHGWAECSLVMAENVLASEWGLPPPAWINATQYDEYVLFHHDETERAKRGGWHQG